MSDDLAFNITETKLPDRGRLLGIDFGTVRIGLAICDPSQSIASPLTVYHRRNEKLDSQFFNHLVSQEQVVGLVIGLPLHLSGQASEKSLQASEYGRRLAAQTGLPIAWVDERFSTSMARGILSQSSMSGKKKKAQLDKLAAQIILTVYLETIQQRPSTNRE